MKQSALFILLATFSLHLAAEGSTYAGGKLYASADASKETQLCLAALESRDAVRAKAKELGVNRRQLKLVTCNVAGDDCQQTSRSRGQGACPSLSLAEFARMHKDDMREWSIATVQ